MFPPALVCLEYLKSSAGHKKSEGCKKCHGRWRLKGPLAHLFLVYSTCVCTLLYTRQISSSKEDTKENMKEGGYPWLSSSCTINPYTYCWTVIYLQYVPRGELKQGKVHTHREEAGGNWWNPPLKRGADDRMGGGGGSYKNIFKEEQMSSISIHFPNFFLLVKKWQMRGLRGPIGEFT